jgi:nicotinate phosphoribosyltransferase
MSYSQLTMQQAVFHQFRNTQATYRFTNRSRDTLFTRQSAEAFTSAVSSALLAELL